MLNILWLCFFVDTIGHCTLGFVFRWDFRWVLNSDWDQRSAKKWSCFFHLYSAIHLALHWDQTSDWVIVESKAN